MLRARLIAPPAAALALLLSGCGDGTSAPGSAMVDAPAAIVQAQPEAPRVQQAANGPLLPTVPPEPLAVELDDVEDPVVYRPRKPPRAGLLFDLDTGEVLWRKDPLRRLPIASVTKTMTAILVARRVPEGARVKVTNEARARPGSRIGLLPRKKRVGVGALLNGLMIVSGNDAAIALAQRVSGTVPRFVELMNRTAQEMHLSCTSFASPDGLDDQGFSCPQDLAALARAALDEPRVAAVVSRPRAVLPFPTKGGKLYLYSHNPLIRAGYRGAIGVKTGFTKRAGRCFVGAAERDGRRLGVVLLHSPDPGKQARQLLDRGWRVPAGA
ncbi:MAG: D-alanyl-D-alanine carboxypeptidase [Solirubrobacterales bacterium]|nr:D-alanyl-D-alanine carboxypeptidase [Solirubrobacterales bacterium]